MVRSHSKYVFRGEGELRFELDHYSTQERTKVVDHELTLTNHQLIIHYICIS